VKSDQQECYVAAANVQSKEKGVLGDKQPVETMLEKAKKTVTLRPITSKKTSQGLRIRTWRCATGTYLTKRREGGGR